MKKGVKYGNKLERPLILKAEKLEERYENKQVRKACHLHTIWGKRKGRTLHEHVVKNQYAEILSCLMTFVNKITKMPF